MKRFASFFTNDPEWSVKPAEKEMYDEWLLSERENLKAQIKSLNEEQRMLFEFIKGQWWNPKDPTPPKRHLLEIIGDAGKFINPSFYFQTQMKLILRNWKNISLRMYLQRCIIESRSCCSLHRIHWCSRPTTGDGNFYCL